MKNRDPMLTRIAAIAASAAALHRAMSGLPEPAEVAARPEALPIETAPIGDGDEVWPPESEAERAEWCLLWAPLGRYPATWRFGRWTGEGWSDDDGHIIRPSHWAPLPPAPR